MCKKSFAAVVVVLSLFFPALAPAAFDPPKDGVVSEQQLVNYLAVVKESIAYLQEVGKAVDQSKTGFGAMAAISGADEKLVAIRKKHGLADEAEMNWVAEQAVRAWSAAAIDEAFAGAGGTNAVENQAKESEKALAAAEKKLAAHEAALKAGKRVLDDEERKSIVDQAKQDEAGALEEAKQHADEAKEAKDDPAAAAEARKQEAEARTRAKLAAARAQAPDVPQTEEEKAQAKQENEQSIESLKQEVAAGKETVVAMKNAAAEFAKSMQEARKDVPVKNVELVKKHLKEFKAAFGMEK